MCVCDGYGGSHLICCLLFLCVSMSSFLYFLQEKTETVDLLKPYVNVNAKKTQMHEVFVLICCLLNVYFTAKV